jgi:YD repeat-containing protein
MRPRGLSSAYLTIASVGFFACGGEAPVDVPGDSGLADSGVVADDGGEIGIDANPIDANVDAGGLDAQPTDRGDGAIPILTPPPAPADPSDFVGANRFLFDGPNAIQFGVVPGAIPDVRMSVLHGVVLDTSGAPLSGVAITILGKPEFGETLSRADGRFDFALAGGGSQNVNFARSGYVTLQRRFVVGWHADVWIDDVMMTELDLASTEIILRGATEPQVHEASMKSDADGQRHPVLVFRPGTNATMQMPDGTLSALDTLNVRATELTIGPDGMKAMPGDLPANVGYTFADELTVDEAVVAGASSVVFDPPVLQYVENFLNFPAGTPVPNGSFDRQRGVWVGEPDGRVIALLSEAGGEAAVDADGDGQADPDGGASLGIDAEERRVLAARYEAPTTIWRVPIPHFSSWDHNWGFGPPDDADPPDRDDDDPPPFDPCKKRGSTIHCQNGVLIKDLSVPGAEEIHWSSQVTPARRAIDGRPAVRITGATVHPDLLRVEAEIVAWGNTLRATFPPSPNQLWHPEINEDAYGRPTVGMTQARITVRNVFRANYQVPASSNDNWGSSGSGVTIEGDRERAEIMLVLRYVKRIGLPTGRDDSALGGWAFASHHRFDRGRNVVHQGNGEVRPLPLIGTFRKLGFGGQGRSYDFIGQEVDAATLRLNSLAGIKADPDGSVWIMGDIRGDGTGRTIINVRDGRARISELPLGPRLCVNAVCAREMEQLPDGRLVMLLPHSVHTYDPRTGTTERVGGTSDVDAPNATPFPDGSRATDVPLQGVTAMAVSPGGEIYVAHKYGSVGAFRLIRIDPLGRIFFVGGTDAADNLVCDEFAQEGDLVRETCFTQIRSLAFDLEGNLLIAGMRQWAPAGYGAIVRVGADGRLAHVAGCTDAGCAPGPLEHRNQQLDFGSSVFGPQSIEGRPDGKILARGVRVGGGAGGMFYAVDPVVGSSAVVAGGVESTAAARTLGTPATHSFFYGEGSQSYGPLGLVLDVPEEGSNNPVLAVLDEPAALDRVPSEDGTEVWHFDPAGLHLRTTDAITGRLLREFSYDPEGRLVSFRDADNNVTTIERDGSGVPLAIVAPTGERSTLSLDTDGNLVELATPAGRRTTASYLAGGLLERLTDARGGVYNYSYDANARLIGSQGPDGVGATLAFSETHTTRTAVHTTNGNITSTYLTESLDEVGRRLTRTEASGAIASFTIRSTGVPAVVEENAYRTLTSVVAPDPRFGLLAPVLQSFERGPGTPRVLLAESVAITGSPANPDTFVQSITSPYGTETMSHDRAAATMTFGSSSGRSAVLTLDAQGRPQTLAYPGRDLQSRTYDAGGRLSTISEGGFVARYDYSPNGHLASITDADGEVYAFERDLDGRVNGLVDPSSRRTVLGRNGMGDLTSLTLADGTIHTLARSPGGRLSSYVAPGGATTGFGYDVDGQHATTTLPSGRTLTLQRDGTNRVTTIATPEATTTLTYADPNQSGRVYEQLWTPSTGVVERTVTTFTAERLTRLSHFAGASEVFRMSYVYDSSGRVTQHSLLAPSAGSRAYALEVDDDQLTTLYGPFGREVDFDRSGPLGGAVAITSDRLNQTLRYDGRGALVGRTTLVNGIPLYSYDLTRAANGRITERREVIGTAPPTLSSYGYDAAGRLTSVARDAVAAEAYTYDARDNRTSRTIAAGPAELSSYAAGRSSDRPGHAQHRWPAHLARRGHLHLRRSR